MRAIQARPRASTHLYYAEKAIQQRSSQTKSEADDNPVFDLFAQLRIPEHQTTHPINTYMKGMERHYPIVNINDLVATLLMDANILSCERQDSSTSDIVYRVRRKERRRDFRVHRMSPVNTGIRLFWDIIKVGDKTNTETRSDEHDFDFYYPPTSNTSVHKK
jgi:hypothetical protein